ncbi:DNA helicase [Reticulomyxa filosa]|uniref:DNA helicase n=1 Tax=Reticulomyxa filosa TaxID=46433 RepID=X6LBY5_RETFI|nr:DNA helicase [Reticulomyxa filosa]|eukprot:ETN98855.1 DNA helicase [Reticulomyxa filosa]
MSKNNKTKASCNRSWGLTSFFFVKINEKIKDTHKTAALMMRINNNLTNLKPCHIEVKKKIYILLDDKVMNKTKLRTDEPFSLVQRNKNLSMETEKNEKELQKYMSLLQDEDLLRNLADGGRKVKDEVNLLDAALLRNKARQYVQKEIAATAIRAIAGTGGGASSKASAETIPTAKTTAIRALPTTTTVTSISATTTTITATAIATKKTTKHEIDTRKSGRHSSEEEYDVDESGVIFFFFFSQYKCDDYEKKKKKNYERKVLLHGLGSDKKWKTPKEMKENDLADLINSLESLIISKDSKRTLIKTISKYLTKELYPHQVQALQWLTEREETRDTKEPKGGIIADEMGLGKTIQMIALMLREKVDEREKNRMGPPKKEEEEKTTTNESQDKNKLYSDGTLVICPLSVMDHWAKEIESFVKDKGLTVYKYHGSSRLNDALELTRCNFGVVLTTYGCVQADYTAYRKKVVALKTTLKALQSRIGDPRKEKDRDKNKNKNKNKNKSIESDDSDEDGANALEQQCKRTQLKLVDCIHSTQDHVLARIHWRRVILDEAHTIKNPKSQTHKAVCSLECDFRWFVTGTPIQNSLDDLYAAFHFLRFAPYSDYSFWKKYIFQNPDGISLLKVLFKLLGSIMLRRCKSGSLSKPLVQLPSKQLITHEIDFTDLESQMYKRLHTYMTKLFAQYVAQNTVGTHFSRCLSMLLRLRQACNDFRLLPVSLVERLAQQYDTPQGVVDLSKFLDSSCSSLFGVVFFFHLLQSKCNCFVFSILCITQTLQRSFQFHLSHLLGFHLYATEIDVCPVWSQFRVFTTTKKKKKKKKKK